MRRWLLLLLFIPLFGFFLKEKCREESHKESQGDFIFYRQDHQIIYLSIYDQTPETIVIEELHTLDNNPHLNLKDPLSWIQQGGKGHSQWLLYELDLATGEVLEAFSPPKRSFIAFGTENPILSKFLLIEWEVMPDTRRKQVPKTKKVWSPPKRIKNVPSPVEKSQLWRCYWAKDGSVLEGLRIDLHWDTKANDTFPYQIEIHDQFRPITRLQQIHQGKNGLRAAPYFPRRHPIFVQKTYRKGDFLYAEYECTKAFTPVKFFIEDLDTHQLTPITPETDQNKETYKLKIHLPSLQIPKGRPFRLVGQTAGKHQTRFDSIEVFELN